jgi:LmbE family N-acetylglucosaminyl deacetylase
MKTIYLLVLLLLLPWTGAAQESATSPAPAAPPAATADDRFKADILIVVAHPDDESAAAPYLARAINDQGKRVAVVFCTHGEGGANEAGSEHAASLGAVREIEARRGLADAGIENVWFVDGHDTASQNVLQSLAHWGHGNVLEQVVRLVRLTRAEVIITWLPAVFVGENHGDHQAAGVIATEAFDLAGDPTAFPAQLAEPTKRLEAYLEGLRPWQPKKIYYFSDAHADAPFVGKGPAYSIGEISPSRHLPYWRLGLVQARYYRSQFKKYADIADKGTDQEIAALFGNGTQFWSDPLPFVFGKSVVKSSVAGDIFEGVAPGPIPFSRAPGYQPASRKDSAQEAAGVSLELAGPWGFYQEFRRAHDLAALPSPETPEIGIEAGQPLLVPLRIRNDGAAPREVTLSVSLPAGWTAQSVPARYAVSAGDFVPVQVTVTPAGKPADDLYELVCKIEASGQSAGAVKLRVKFRRRALPQ